MDSSNSNNSPPKRVYYPRIGRPVVLPVWTATPGEPGARKKTPVNNLPSATQPSLPEPFEPKKMGGPISYPSFQGGPSRKVHEDPRKGGPPVWSSTPSRPQMEWISTANIVGARKDRDFNPPKSSSRRSESKRERTQPVWSSSSMVTPPPEVVDDDVVVTVDDDDEDDDFDFDFNDDDDDFYYDNLFSDDSEDSEDSKSDVSQITVIFRDLPPKGPTVDPEVAEVFKETVKETKSNKSKVTLLVLVLLVIIAIIFVALASAAKLFL